MRTDTPTHLPVPAVLRRWTDLASKTGILLDRAVLDQMAGPAHASPDHTSPGSNGHAPRHETVAAGTLRALTAADGVLHISGHGLSARTHRLTMTTHRVQTACEDVPDALIARPGRHLIQFSPAHSELHALAALSGDETLSSLLTGKTYVWSALQDLATTSRLKVSRHEVKHDFLTSIARPQTTLDARSHRVISRLRTVFPALYAYLDDAFAAGHELGHVHQVAAAVTNELFVAVARALDGLAVPVLFLGGDTMVTEARTQDLPQIRERLTGFTVPSVMGAQPRMTADYGTRLSKLVPFKP